MIELRPRAKLGGANLGWLDTKHHFSFASYQDTDRMNWGQLRVLNDDTIAPHTGFPPHPHNDMEIITYVREGAISHKDSLGNAGRTEAGEVQVMTAGTGIVHAEHNHENVITKIFQIWLLPAKLGLKPRWESRPFPKASAANAFVRLAGGGRSQGDAMDLNADGSIHGATLAAGCGVVYAADPRRHLYLVVASGEVKVKNKTLHEGDGLAIVDEHEIAVDAEKSSEILLIDAGV